ncbi:MAG: metallophosphoesterase [Anaerolineales bacterium]|nr:metallophosphoesterase [Anaerolineales bacterium]
MLVIVSDLHLGDGTTADSIPASAFDVFARRLQETAYFASWRKDGSYSPIDSLDVVLLGDILDPLHSTLWLNARDLRPWSDPYRADYAAKLTEVTRAILDYNKDSLEILRRCAKGKLIRLAPATRGKKPDFKTSEQIQIKVRFHYMVGNHDWYYHLRGEAFDQIRAEIIKAMGLSNPVSPFPYEADESPFLRELFERYKVHARHGDVFDKFNYDSEKGRDHGTLGDAFTMEVANRYPIEAQKRYGDELPSGVVDSLRRITNVRPALAAPLWISGQIKAHAGANMQEELKDVWDEIAHEFLQLDFVRQLDKSFQFDIVDAMELVLKISDRASFSTINDIVVWVHEKMWGGERSFLENALREPAFLDNSARYIIYGHTHHYEVIPLDAKGSAPYVKSQIYFNSGSWHSYYDLAMKNPSEQKFIPYQALAYLTFYADGEHESRAFDAWSGVYA